MLMVKDGLHAGGSLPNNGYQHILIIECDGLTEHCGRDRASVNAYTMEEGGLVFDPEATAEVRGAFFHMPDTGDRDAFAAAG